MRWFIAVSAVSLLSACAAPERPAFATPRPGPAPVDAVQWNAGDVVAVAVGGPVMTVAHCGPRTCHTLWFDQDKELRSGDFVTDNLFRITLAETQDAGHIDEARGSEVRLASGGLRMSVVGRHGDKVQVQWRKDRALEQLEVPLGALVNVDASDDPPCDCAAASRHRE